MNSNCVYCHSAIDGDDFQCPGCGSRLHVDCANEIGSCPVVGCDSGTSAPPPRGAMDRSDHALSTELPPHAPAAGPPAGPPHEVDAPSPPVDSRPPLAQDQSWSIAPPSSSPLFPPPPTESFGPTPTSHKRRPHPGLIAAIVVAILLAIGAWSGGSQRADERRAHQMASRVCFDIATMTYLEASIVLLSALETAESEGIGDLFIDALWDECPVTMEFMTS